MTTMAKEKDSAKSLDSLSRDNTRRQDNDPSTSHLYLPPTPPATDEPIIDTFAIDEVLHSVHVAQVHYELFFETLERELHRFDFEPDTELLTLRMPSLVHDFFSTLLAQ
jgi:hypothetical protein